MCDVISFKNYISDEFSICREERQYALYLSNVLRYYGKNPDDETKTTNRIDDNEKVKSIFEACFVNKKDLKNFNNEEERKRIVEEELKNIVVENVFYEATFMRDFFERKRENYFEKDDPKITEENKIHSFNLALLEYCWIHFLQQKSIDELNGLVAKTIKRGEMKENNYGARNEIPFLKKYVGQIKKNFKNEEDFKKELNNIENTEEFLRSIKLRKIVRAMMNAKPDLAVIYYNYKENGVKKLLFIECKYESKEDNYMFYSVDENEKIIKNSISQRAVQGYIAEFLCEFSGYMNEIALSKIMYNDEPKKNEGKYLSKMIRFVTDPAKENEGQINIKDLIQIEEDIFNKNK